MLRDTGDFRESFAVRTRLLEWLETRALNDLRTIADGLGHCFKNGGALFACGNGGSASQAEHFVAELAGRFKLSRKPLPAFALSTNSSIVTAVSNDFGYSEVFSRQLEGAASQDDVLVAISTSGRSQNVLNACRTARDMGLKIFALTGQESGVLAEHSDVALSVPDADTARIQEIHLIALHLLCQMVEESLFSPTPTRSQRL